MAKDYLFENIDNEIFNQVLKVVDRLANPK